MAQITLYVDEKTLRRIEQGAKRDRKSLSSWVVMKLNIAVENVWPEGYFDLFGKLQDADLIRPDQPRAQEDRRGKKL